MLAQMPAFVPLDLGNLQEDALKYDRTAYKLSDTDFARRHRPIVKAERLFQDSVLADQRGDSSLMPAMQNEFMRAGISGALANLGDTPGVLSPGSAGEAGVARNLGISIAGLQDRNRANRNSSLQLAETIFPRRTFGMTGENAIQVSSANNMGENNWNQANYANQVQQQQYQQQLDAQAEAGKMQLVGQIASSIGSVVGMAAGACHIAREILGVEDVRWTWFKQWLYEDAPYWFRNWYLHNSRTAAKWLSKHKFIKAILKPVFVEIAERKGASMNSEQREYQEWIRDNFRDHFYYA